MLGYQKLHERHGCVGRGGEHIKLKPLEAQGDRTEQQGQRVTFKVAKQIDRRGAMVDQTRV